MSSVLQRHRHLLVPAALGLLVLAAQAWALDLKQAKAQGLVGETPGGYLGIVAPRPSDELRALVSRINAARRTRYREIASRNGTDLRTVELLAGKKAIEATPSGQYVQDAKGRWVKKP